MEYLRKVLSNRIDMAVLEYAKFEANFARDALYAMEWADSLFEAAATIEVYKAVVKRIDEGDSYEEIAENLTDAILRGARSPDRSTSDCRNLAAQYRLSATVRARELVIDYSDHDEK